MPLVDFSSISIHLFRFPTTFEIQNDYNVSAETHLSEQEPKTFAADRRNSIFNRSVSDVCCSLFILNSFMNTFSNITVLHEFNGHPYSVLRTFYLACCFLIWSTLFLFSFNLFSVSDRIFLASLLFNLCALCSDNIRCRGVAINIQSTESDKHKEVNGHKIKMTKNDATKRRMQTQQKKSSRQNDETIRQRR